MAFEFKKSHSRTFADSGEPGQVQERRLASKNVASVALISRLRRFIFGNSGLSAVNDNESEALSLTDEGVRAFVDETVYRARRYQRPLSIILFSIGRKAPPAHLRNVAPEVAPHLRRLDLCILLEPEDLFLVLCPELDDEGVGAFAHRLTTLLEEQFSGADIDIEIHSATATLPGAATTFDGLLGLARQRLQLS